MAGNWDPLGGSGGAPATSGADPLSSSSAAGGWDPLGGGTSHAPAKKSAGRGLLGGIVHGLGSAASSAFGVIKGVPSVVGTLATAIPKELAPSNPFKMQHALPASQRGWQNVKKEMPLTAGSLGSLAQTARQIPDTAIGSLEPGVGFGKTNLGRQVKQQGVLNTGIAKAADLSMLLGGVGAIGEGLGAGRLARIVKLDDIANASIKAGQFGKIADATDAATQATKAAAAGDVERATNLDSISKTLAEKESLAAQGPGSVGEKVTAGAVKGAKLGAKIAGGPAEVWTKPLGLAAKGLGAIPGVEEGVAAVSEAAKNSKLGKGRAASKVLKEAASENITGEQARLNHSVFQGFKAAKDIVGKDEHAQAAVILDRIGTAKAAGQHLAGLSDDELSRALGVHAKPEAFKLAHDYAAGTLGPETAAKLDAASQTLETNVYQPKQQRFLKGYGEAKKVSAETLSSRASEIANPHEPSPAGLSAETMRRQRPIIGQQERSTQLYTKKLNAVDKLIQKAATPEEKASLLKRKDRFVTEQVKRQANYATRHGAAATAAAESAVAQPAATRATLYQLRDIKSNLTQMADEAETAGDTAKATDLRARADALPKTAKDLKAAGVTPKYVYGGENPAEGVGGKATPKLTGRKILGTSRLKETGVVPTTFEGQAQKALENARGTARNEFSPKLAGHLGNASTKTVVTDHPELQGLKGEDLGAALKDAGYRAWDPHGTGRVIPESDWHKLTADTPIIPKEFAGRVDQMVRVPEGAEETYAQLLKKAGLKGLDKTTQLGRFAKLFEPGWQLKKTLGDPAMMAAMGVTPAHVAVHLPEALRAVGDGELTPHLGAAGEGRMAMDAPKTKLDAAARKGANAIFTPFQKADALAREIAYRSKIADGLSPQAAAAAVRRGLGDLHDLTAAEQGVAKRVFTFYPWQRHVAQTMLRLPLEHPAGLAQAAHIQQLANPDGTKSPNTLEQETNPFESSVLSMIHGSAADKQTGALGSQVNPAIRALFGGALGVSPSHGFSAISTPGQQFGAGPQLGFAVKHPAEFAKFVGHMLPPVVTAQNLLNTKPAAGGKIPQRFETGEPIRHGVKNTGAPKAATAGARTRADALKQILGLPLPAPKLKKKK